MQPTRCLTKAARELASLREAARRTGVSANATYRHFADKEALLAALATRGFVELAETLVEAAAQASDPMAAMGQAYVRFALARPGRFRLMFGPTIADRELYPELKYVVAQIRQMLLGAVQSRRRPEMTLGRGRFAHGQWCTESPSFCSTECCQAPIQKRSFGKS